MVKSESKDSRAKSAHLARESAINFSIDSDVGQAHALPRLSRVRTEQQPCGELHGPGAIGRRNWTHIGHEKAGPRVATILFIVETYRRIKIPIREYLAAVLPGLANTSIHRLPQLTPTARAASNL
jgi:hypothetical protein